MLHDTGSNATTSLSQTSPEQGAHPLRGVCWHFTHVLLDAETQLLQATGLVAIDAVLAGSPKPVV